MGHFGKIPSREDAQTHDARLSNNDHPPFPVVHLEPLMQAEVGVKVLAQFFNGLWLH